MCSCEVSGRLRLASEGVDRRYSGGKKKRVGLIFYKRFSFYVAPLFSILDCIASKQMMLEIRLLVEQKFDERFLGVKTVFCLIPDCGGGCIHKLSADLFSAVGG